LIRNREKSTCAKRCNACAEEMQRAGGRLATIWRKSCYKVAERRSRVALIKSMGCDENGRDVTPCPALFINRCFSVDFCMNVKKRGSRAEEM
jgi:hypothetical protein